MTNNRVYICISANVPLYKNFTAVNIWLGAGTIWVDIRSFCWNNICSEPEKERNFLLLASLFQCHPNTRLTEGPNWVPALPFRYRHLSVTWDTQKHKLNSYFTWSIKFDMLQWTTQFVTWLYFEDKWFILLLLLSWSESNRFLIVSWFWMFDVTNRCLHFECSSKLRGCYWFCWVLALSFLIKRWALKTTLTL